MRHLDDPRGPLPHSRYLVDRLAGVLAWDTAHTRRVMSQVGLVDPLVATLTQERTDAFINLAYASPADYATPAQPPRTRTAPKTLDPRQQLAQRPARRPAATPAGHGSKSRDIEFAVQVLQLVHGGADPELRAALAVSA